MQTQRRLCSPFDRDGASVGCHNTIRPTDWKMRQADEVGEQSEPMTAELISEFEGVTLTEYLAVSKELGIDPESGEGNWPEGLLAHSVGLNETGHVVVIEIWDSVEDQAHFREERLDKALAVKGHGHLPSRTWIKLVYHNHLES